MPEIKYPIKYDFKLYEDDFSAFRIMDSGGMILAKSDHEQFARELCARVNEERWIACADRLPDEGKGFIWAAFDMVRLKEETEKRNSISNADDIQPVDYAHIGFVRHWGPQGVVTHWKPFRIPLPPTPID